MHMQAHDKCKYTRIDMAMELVAVQTTQWTLDMFWGVYL